MKIVLISYLIFGLIITIIGAMDTIKLCYDNCQHKITYLIKLIFTIILLVALCPPIILYFMIKAFITEIKDFIYDTFYNEES